MTSIRQRLFFLIGSMILLVFGLIIISNSLFMEQFYIGRQESTLVDSFQRINQMQSLIDGDALESYIAIETSSHVDIILMDDEGNIEYASNNYIDNERYQGQKAGLLFFFGAPGMTRPGPGGGNPNRPSGQPDNQSPLSQPVPQGDQLDDFRLLSSTDAYRVQRGSDPITGGQTIALTGTLDDGHYLILRTPLESIKESIGLMNQFLILILVVVTIVAALATFVLSSYFTNPIKKINSATARLTTLDFSEPCEVTTKDELGQLAVNINTMSGALEDTISSLNDSNNHLKEEIEAKTRLDNKRRELLNNVSHELKTPLALMQGYAEGLSLNVANNPDKVQFYCDVITEETLKMNQLVQQLLNIDQLEFGDIKKHPKSFNLNTYINETLQKYRPIMDKDGITLDMNLYDNTFVYADPFLVDQIMTNYITNAIRYCDDNKAVSVRTSLNYNTQDDRDVVRIEIFNTAPAIDKDKLELLFDSFYKLDQARTRDKGGHGLGLSIVKAIQDAEKLGYGCENQDNGVVFWFELPVAYR